MTVARARALRKRMTAEELTLWFQLRQLKALGWRFRRQSPEEPYILDFVCREASLVIEVDGAHHGDPKQSEYDARRDLFLREHGLTVLRFWAGDVRENLDGVITEILAALDAAVPTRRAPAAPAHDTLPVPGREFGRRYARLVRLGLHKPT